MTIKKLYSVPVINSELITIGVFGSYCTKIGSSGGYRRRKRRHNFFREIMRFFGF